jgi:hypothetical protein
MVAWFIVAVLALPLAVASATGAALSPRGTSVAAISLATLLILISQPLVAAGLLRVWLSAVSDSRVGLGRATLAMLIALAVDLAAAVALPDGAALPVVGVSWTGATVAGGILASGA